MEDEMPRIDGVRIMEHVLSVQAQGNFRTRLHNLASVMGIQVTNQWKAKPLVDKYDDVVAEYNRTLKGLIIPRRALYREYRYWDP